MVVTFQKVGSPRRTVGLNELNAASMRETCHTVSIQSGLHRSGSEKENIPGPMKRIPQLTAFTVLQDVTTYITKYDRYRYIRAP